MKFNNKKVEEKEEKEELYEEEVDKKKYLWKYLGALFLILIVILMIVPFSSIKLDPEPTKIPDYNDVVLTLPKINMTFNRTINNKNDFLKFINPKDTYIKGLADRIANYGCEKTGEICNTKAIFYFVRDKLNYIKDPVDEEYVKTAKETILNKGGDCDDLSVLLANLLNSIGVETRFVFVPNHIFVQANIPEALKKYKEKGGDWISLDPACEYCKFGEVSLKSWNDLKKKN